VGAKPEQTPGSSPWLWRFFPIDDSQLLLQMIGSDGSAFAKPPQGGRQSKTKESSECSIHNEGLREHPIKN
jgi:hypothetical protein